MLIIPQYDFFMLLLFGTTLCTNDLVPKSSSFSGCFRRTLYGRLYCISLKKGYFDSHQLFELRPSNRLVCSFISILLLENILDTSQSHWSHFQKLMYLLIHFVYLVWAFVWDGNGHLKGSSCLHCLPEYVVLFDQHLLENVKEAFQPNEIVIDLLLFCV